MPATELQKKTITLIVFVGLTIMILSALPVVELWLQTSILPRFGLNFAKGWTLTPESAQISMNSAYANAIDATLRIIKIILWMMLVIAIVRFIAYFVLKTVYRNSKQPDVSS